MEDKCLAVPSELGSEALTMVISGIRSWLAMRSFTVYALRKEIHKQHLKAMSEELVALGMGSGENNDSSV